MGAGRGGSMTLFEQLGAERFGGMEIWEHDGLGEYWREVACNCGSMTLFEQ